MNDKLMMSCARVAFRWRLLAILAIFHLLLGCGPAERRSETETETETARAQESLLAPDVLTNLNGNEPHLAISPINNQIVAAAVFRSVSLSFDGGRTFTVTVNAPVPATHGSGGGDPVLGFDAQGRLFFTYLALVANIVPPGPAGFGGPDLFVQQIDARPPGTAVPSRLLDAAGTECGTAGANANECPVNVTGALNLNLPAANNVNPNGRSHDRQWMAVDSRPACPTPTPPRNTRTCSPFSGNLYLIWTDFPPPGGQLVARVASSANQGAVGTWATQVISLPAEGFTQQTHMAVATNGDVWAAYHAQPTFSAAGEPNGTTGQIVTLVSTTGAAGGFGARSSPFAAGQADVTFNTQQCACGAGTCNANPAQACTFFATTCPGAGCECAAGDVCNPPAGCANNPIPGWGPCSRRLPASQSLTQGSATPYVVTDITNPNNIAVVASQDPNVGVPGDNFDVGVVTATDAATAATPTWSAPQPILPGGAAIPIANQLFPTAVAATNNTQCVTVMYYDDRNPNPSVNGNSLLDLFVTVTPNLWAAGGPAWGPERQINSLVFDPDIGNVGADFNPFCGRPPVAGCVEPAGWRVTNRMGEYNGLVHAAGASFVANGPAGTPQQSVFDYSDAIPPVVTAPAAVTVNTCTPNEAAFGTPTATDTCGLPPLTTDSNFSGVLVPGPNTVTWTATDGAANVSAGAAQIVTVTDIQKPVFTFVPPAITVSDCSAPNIGEAEANDTNTGNCGPVVITNDAPAVFPLGTTTVTWFATDAAGNVQTATQIVTAELGDDPSCCPAGTNVIVGTASSNLIFGTSGADCILGLGGNDDIFGRGGNDFISGGEGNDDLDGDDGADYMSGGNGDDHLDGDSGNDTLLGGAGKDFLDAEGGNDICEGGPGNDHLDGDSGSDILRGGTGDDFLEGDSGNDVLEGGAGEDDLFGGSDDDALDGGPDEDDCSGGLGNDTELNCE